MPAVHPVLVVQHQGVAPVGLVGEWLLEAGVGLDVRRCDAGDPLPASLDDHAGLVVLGGHMGVYDDTTHPWLIDTKRLVREAADRSVPTLGICLGHQLAAVALGGTVERNAAGQRVGVHPIGWVGDAAEDAVVGAGVGAPGGDRCLQWNSDVVTQLPDGAVALARNAFGELQAARFAPTVWGVQWHPEADSAVAADWGELDRRSCAAAGVDVDAVVAEVRAAEPALRSGARPIVAAFAAHL